MENDVNINDNIEDNDENMSDADYQIQRRIRHNQLQRCLRKSQIGLSRLRFFLKICFVILLIYVGYRALKLPMWYIKKDIFNTAHNQYLTIQNNKIVPDYKILSGLRNARIPDKPIYMITPKIFEDNIKKLEPIKNVHVRRFWYPARLSVVIEERRPLITIAPQEDVEPIGFFTEGGVLIGREYLPLPENYKTYLVLSYGIKGDDYRLWDEAKILKIEKLAKLIEACSKEKLLYLDFRNPNDIYAQIESVKIRVGELNNTVFERVSSLPSILPELKTITNTVKYVDLSWEKAKYIKFE